MNHNQDIIERLKSLSKKMLFPLGVVILFFAVSAIFFTPQYQGKTLAQHDVLQYEGMCHDIMENREAVGEDAQWTGNLFGGMPATLINIEYPSQIVKGYVGSIVNLVGNPTAFIFFAMVAMWITTLLFGMKRWVGVIAALAYGLSTYTILIIGAGHITKIWAMVYAPMMVGATYYTLRRNMWVGAALTALFTSLEIGANHLQITYYFAIAMAALWVSEGIYARKENRLKDWGKRTALLLAAGLFALGSNFSPLWQTMQHQKETTRGGSELKSEQKDEKQEGLDFDYAVYWSYGKSESFNMLVPNYMGGASTDDFQDDAMTQQIIEQAGFQGFSRYFGDQAPTAGPTYLGAAIILLALLGIAILPNRQRWWIVAACGIALLLAWGKNISWLTELLYNYLPFYNKLRAPATALVILQWAAPLLAAMAIAYIIKHREEQQQRLRKALYWTTGVVSGLLIIFAVAGGVFHDSGRENTYNLIEKQFGANVANEIPEEFYDAVTDSRESALKTDALRSLIFVLLTAAIVWLYIERKWVGKYAFCGAVALISTVDLFAIDKRYLAEKHFVEQSEVNREPSQVDKLIMEHNTDGARVLNLTTGSAFNDASTSYFHRSIGGYHGAKLSRYQDIISKHLAYVEYYLLNAENEEQYNYAYYNRVLDILNTRYLITPEGIFERETACGNAWMVGEVIHAESADEEIELLDHEYFYPELVAIAGKEFAPSQEKYSATGVVELTEYRPNYLRYESYSEGGLGLAVFSEIFTEQGWSVTIDGKPATPLRVNYILRAVELPEGHHVIEWSYRAPNWKMTEGITLGFALMILGSCLAILIYYIVKKR